jgi:PAS domain S-box-containing protein
LNSCRVLIIEDEAIVAWDIEDRLKAMGYRTVGRGESFKDAIALTESTRPDMVLMDIRLKGEKDGISAAEEIRHRFHIPVIFLTAYSEDTTLERAKFAEPFGFILKPFNNLDLKTAIEIALYKHQTAEELRRTNRLYDVLIQVNQAAARIRSEEELLHSVCRLMVERGEIDLAWVGHYDPEHDQSEPFVHFGDHVDLLKQPQVSIDKVSEARDLHAKAILERKPQVCNGGLEGLCPFPSGEGVLPVGYRSCAYFPLLFRGSIWGTFNLCVSKADYFKGPELRLMEEVASDISFTLEKIDDERRRSTAEEALAKSRAEFEAIFISITDAIVFTDTAGRILMVNPAFVELFGYGHQEVKGRTTEFFHKDRDLYRELWRRLFQNIEKVGPSISEIQFVRKDGALIDVETRHVVVKDAKGDAIGFLCVHRDITERKVAAAERVKLEAQLRQAMKLEAVGRLAGGVAHDFNNMLGVILGHAEIALEGTLPGDSRYADLRQIQSAATRSANLTRQLLAFARKQTVSPKAVNLNDIISGMLKMLRRLIGENIELAWKPGNDLWNVRIDVSQVDQTLANLVVNARDAIDEFGKITIETLNTEVDEAYCRDLPECMPGSYVMLTVTDTGAGMEKEMLEHVFEPFFTTKAVGKGTGLGLSTVYGVVKQNQGFVNVYSEVGYGTTFRIYLPRFDEIVEGDLSKEHSAPTGGKETILMVEDETSILELVEALLTRLGYRVITAGTPADAIQRVETLDGKIDLLITDVVLPEMNGRDLAERIGRLKPGLKCLFISGYTANAIAHHGVLNEGVAFLQKPFSMKDLADKVRDVLDETAGR